MAAMADPSTSQEIPDSVSYPRKKIRIIAKIQELIGGESETSNGCLSSCISFEDPVEKSNAQTRIRLSDLEAGKSETFKLDCCYGKDEATNSVFSKEISSLIAGIFHGFNSTILFYGGKTSGKNSVMQGLIPLSMGEILSTSGRMAYVVKLSCYEVRCEPHGDRCYDLLEPKDKEVYVWEDKDGKIQLKGLAQVPVQSVSDFNGVFSSFTASGKTSQKGFLEAPRKCHRVGYEGMKQKVENSSQKIQSARINKSLCDLLRVVHGLNLSENGIGWRESKLARILRDSLGVKSQSLLLACLNQNSYQESVWTLNLVSRPCQSTISYRKDTPRPKQNVDTSLKKEVSVATPCRLQSPFTSVSKNRNADKSFFSCSTPCKLQASCGSSKASNKSKFNSRKDVPNAASATTETRKELLPLACTANPKEESVTSDVLPILEEPTTQERMHAVETVSTMEALDIASGVELLSISDEPNVNKENTSLFIKFDETSPPISARLKALKENLEALCSPLPFRTDTPFKDIFIDDSSIAHLDPLTPKAPSDAFKDAGTPLDKFNAMSAGLKKSIAQEYLTLLNTATKKELMKMKVKI
ncbi:Kinesin-like protein [Nymphaea thermarum]|nr:Kinesin-like protein [Nymphaea thermarum]